MCSAALKRLMGMAGRSLAIYNGLADLCRVRLRDSESPYCGVKEASYCTLRSQLLMALHDNNISEITSKVTVLCTLSIGRIHNVLKYQAAIVKPGADVECGYSF